MDTKQIPVMAAEIYRVRKLLEKSPASDFLRRVYNKEEETLLASRFVVCTPLLVCARLLESRSRHAIAVLS
jgi:hypothetical protein